jgi:hypothetical protein
MGRDFDKEIAEAEADVTAFKEQLEVTVAEAVCAAAGFLADWFPKQAQTEVEATPDVALALPKERLTALKAEVQALAGRAGEVAKEALDSATVWPHRSDQQRSDFYASSEYMPQPVEYALKRAMGRLAPVLRKAGYLKDARTHQLPQEYDGGDEYPRGRPRCPKELVGVLKGYCEEYEKFRRAVVHVRKVRDARKQAEAKELWDNA